MWCVVQRSVAAPTTAVLLLHVFDAFQLAVRFNISQVLLRRYGNYSGHLHFT